MRQSSRVSESEASNACLGQGDDAPEAVSPRQSDELWLFCTMFWPKQKADQADTFPILNLDIPYPRVALESETTIHSMR